MINKVGKEDRICGWQSQGRNQLPLLKSYLSKDINLIMSKYDGTNKAQIPIVLPRRKQPKSKFTLIDETFNPFQINRKNIKQSYFQLTPKYKNNIDCIKLPSLPKVNSQRVEDNQRQQSKLKRQQQSDKRSDRSFIKYYMSNEDIAPYKLYKKIVQNQQQKNNTNRQSDLIHNNHQISSKLIKIKLKLSTVEITHKQVLQKSRRESLKKSKPSTIQHVPQDQLKGHKRSRSNVNVHKLTKQVGQKQSPQAQEVFDDKELFGSKSQKIQSDSDYNDRLNNSIDLNARSKRKITYNNVS